MPNDRPAIATGADVEAHVETWVAEHDCPGASVAVVDGSETVCEVGVGQRRLDPPAPATPDTLYGVGSATKPVTATAVLRLVDRGDLALDDPVPDHVPFLEDAPGDPITVHELLSHTSGMPADDSATLVLLDAVFDADPDPSIDGWDAFEAHVAGSTHRRRLDRERFLYYNSGYVVLGRVVEAVTGTPFAEFVEDEVLGPLGMDGATFDVGVIADGSRDAMRPYRRDEDDALEPATLPDNPVFRPPGGLLASVSDLAAFLAAQTAAGPLLDAALRERMYEPVATSDRFVDGTEHGYGYGWETRPFGADTLVGHSGTTAVSAGYVGFLRDRGLGVAVGCNAPPTESPEVLAVELLAGLAGCDPASVLPGRGIERAASQLTGRYESYCGVQSVSVGWTGSRLEVDHETPLGRQTVQFAPESLDLTGRDRAVDDGCDRSAAKFVAVGDDGEVTTAEFFPGDDGVELLLDRVLLRRVDRGAGDS